jgi:hypothetical protein
MVLERGAASRRASDAPVPTAPGTGDPDGVRSAASTSVTRTASVADSGPVRRPSDAHQRAVALVAAGLG